MAEITLKFYGTRGSVPVCNPNFQEFGGDTTCIAIHRKSNNRISIFDAGTGIRDLGRNISKNFPDQEDLFLTFSHFHWDHIQGFPFFEPAYNPDLTIKFLVVGEDRKYTDLRQIFAMQMQEVYFPVFLDNMGARFEFLLREENVVLVNDAIVKTIRQNHPGGSFGYRFEAEGKVIVICTDLEHGEEINMDIVKFARDADLLVHEAQYTTEELKAHRGWGHSSYDQAMEVAEKANVKQLVMTHHDPDHDDQFLKKMEKKCQARFRESSLARVGMSIKI